MGERLAAVIAEELAVSVYGTERMTERGCTSDIIDKCFGVCSDAID